MFTDQACETHARLPYCCNTSICFVDSRLCKLRGADGAGEQAKLESRHCSARWKRSRKKKKEKRNAGHLAGRK